MIEVVTANGILRIPVAYLFEPSILSVHFATFLDEVQRPVVDPSISLFSPIRRIEALLDGSLLCTEATTPAIVETAALLRHLCMPYRVWAPLIAYARLRADFSWLVFSDGTDPWCRSLRAVLSCG